jgi:hypothetical protein
MKKKWAAYVILGVGFLVALVGRFLGLADLRLLALVILLVFGLLFVREKRPSSGR